MRFDKFPDVGILGGKGGGADDGGGGGWKDGCG